MTYAAPVTDQAVARDAAHVLTVLLGMPGISEADESTWRTIAQIQQDAGFLHRRLVTALRLLEEREAVRVGERRVKGSRWKVYGPRRLGAPAAPAAPAAHCRCDDCGARFCFCECRPCVGARAGLSACGGRQ